MMITECAPIDALIQRFGRINRKRTDETIGKFKHIYVIQPPQTDKEALPYDAEVLKRSFDVLPDGDVIEESSVQTMIDTVYPEIPISSIDYSGAVYVDGQWQIKELCHYPKSALLDVLDINSAVCITEGDKDNYVSGNAFNRAEMEIPVSYRSIAHNGLEQIEEGSRPFVVPNKAYDTDKGLVAEYTKLQYFNTL
jgi:CRISPR-associated endonuclease/helicase Cas3